MNALLVHIPKGFASLDWRNNYINIMPMGLFPIANYANALGHRVNVTNLSRYASRDRALDILFERIGQTDARVIGFSLHWHLSALDVLFAISKVKERLPHVHTVIGGISASVYARQFMERAPGLDGVIQGDGERPFAVLLDAIESSGEEWGQVPNLWWRECGEIVFNGVTYVASQEEYSALDFDINKSMFDVEEYVAGRSLFDAMAGNYETVTEIDISERPFFVNIGRGCSYNCVYCSGSRSVFEEFFGRQELCIRSSASVVRTFLDAYELGFRLFHICFDPRFPGKEKFYADVMSGLSSVLNDGRLLFELYELPSRDFIANCAETFSHTTLVYSPCFFDENLMRRYKGYHYSSEEMEESLNLCGEFSKVSAFVYYAITPLESFGTKDIARYVERMKCLRERYGCKVSAMPVMAEPGSPWLLRPNDFGVVDPGIDFDVFLEEWEKSLTAWSPRLCYGMDNVNEVFRAITKGSGNAVLE